jgi:hypothetical protein
LIALVKTEATVRTLLAAFHLPTGPPEVAVVGRTPEEERLEWGGEVGVAARDLSGIKGICDGEKGKERQVIDDGRGVPALKKAFDLPMLRLGFPGLAAHAARR